MKTSEKQTYNTNNVEETAIRAHYLSFAGGLILLNICAEGILNSIPQNTGVYVVAIFLSALIVLAGWLVIRRTPLECDVLLDLCFYDVLLQVFGFFMRVTSANPPYPEPLPYSVLALGLEWLKALCAFWPLLIATRWPAIGPFSLYIRRKYGNSERGVSTTYIHEFSPSAAGGATRRIDPAAKIMLFSPVSNWRLNPSVTRFLVYFFMPLLCVTLAYTVRKIFGSGVVSADTRYLTFAVLAYFLLQNSRAQVDLVHHHNEVL